MSKYLAGAVAAVAGVALALPSAAEISITGGVTEDIGFGSYIGGAESDDDLHFQTDAEIKFQGTGMTDGGLTVTATVEMDADSSGAIDESNLAIAGGFGKIILGTDDNAANMLGNKGIGNGYAGTGYYDGGENYTPAGSPGPIPNSDALGVRYIAPAMGGFQAGISYQVGDNADPAGGATDADNDGNILAVGANFSGDFAGTSMTIGANWVSVDPGDDMEKEKAWGVGMSIGIAATTLSLRYDVKQDTHMVPVFNSAGNAIESRGKSQNTTSYGVGIDHSIGALTFGIGYGLNTQENNAGDGMDTKTTVISAGARYDLGGGVNVHAAVTSGDIENRVTTSAGAKANDPEVVTIDDVDDIGVGLRIALSF